MMILFRLRFDEKKREREEENKEDEPQWGKYSRKGRGYGKSTRRGKGRRR